MSAMMGRIWDAVSLWGLGGLLRDVPELKEAWEDPLFEHAREAGRLELHADTQLMITFHLLGFMLTFCLLASVVPTEWHLRWLWTLVAFIWWMLFWLGMYRRIVRDRLLLLHRADNPRWEELSIDAGRIARLVALKAVLHFDGRGESTKKKGAHATPLLINLFTVMLAWSLPDLNMGRESLITSLVAFPMTASIVLYHSVLSSESWGLWRGWSGLDAFAAQLREHWWVRREMFLHPEVRRTWTREAALDIQSYVRLAGVYLLYLILMVECSAALRTGDLVRFMSVAALCFCALSAGHLWERLRGRSRDLVEFSEAIRDFEGMMALWRRGPSEEEPED